MLGSDFVYDNNFDKKESRIQTFLKENGFSTIQARTYKPVDIVEDVEVVVASKQINNKKLIFIVFRGTQPKSGDEHTKDIKTDRDITFNYDFSKYDKNIRVHNGFMKSEELFEKDLNNIRIGTTTLKTLLKSKPSNVQFLIAGHSLGGAIATLLAARLVDNYNISPDQIVLYTFGAPAVGNRNFQYLFDNNPKIAKTLKYNYRFVNIKDPIPYLTYSVALYHVGFPIKFNENFKILRGNYSSIKKSLKYHGSYLSFFKKYITSYKKMVESFNTFPNQIKINLIDYSSNIEKTPFEKRAIWVKEKGVDLPIQGYIMFRVGKYKKYFSTLNPIWH